MRHHIALLLIAALWFAGAGLAEAADWPRWRGPENTGHVAAGVPIPETLPAEPEAVWSIKVGDSSGSPIVAAGKVFHIDNQGDLETVHALEAATGNPIWSHSFDRVTSDSQSKPGPRGTPLFDDGRLYVESCRGEFQCLNAADGKPLWRTNFVKDFGATFPGEVGAAMGASRHGYTGAALVDGERLIVAVGGLTGAGIVCFNKQTGDVIWKSQNDVAGYAGPVIATLAGVRQVVTFTAEGVIGLNAEDGALLWRVPVKTSFGRHVTVPVVIEDRVIVSSHEVGLICIRVYAEGSEVKTETAWTNKGPTTINFACPVAVGPYLYGVGPNRNLFCLNVMTNELAWNQEEALVTPGGYGGFIVMGANILILSDSGQLHLIAADPKEYRELAQAQVCGRNWCNPAYADGKLYLRDEKNLSCIKLMP